MIKNIVFDLGKVLIDYDFDKFFQKLGYEPQTRQLDEANREILLFEAGKMDKHTFVEELKKIYNFNLSFDEFKNLWCDVFWEIPEMINLAKELKNKGFNLFLFSNTDELHFPYIWQKFPDIKMFENGLMLSYQLGYVKPDKNAYKEALGRYNLLPEQTIFIDDRKENIKTANDFGIYGIVHTDFENTNKEIKKIITLEDK